MELIWTARRVVLNSQWAIPLAVTYSNKVHVNGFDEHQILGWPPLLPLAICNRSERSCTGSVNLAEDLVQHSLHVAALPN